MEHQHQRVDDFRHGAFAVPSGFACLAKAKDVFPHTPQITGAPAPKFVGTVDDFIAKHNNDPALARQMKNRVHHFPLLSLLALLYQNIIVERIINLPFATHQRFENVQFLIVENRLRLHYPFAINADTT